MASAPPKIDRQTTTPFHLKLFYKTDSTNFSHPPPPPRSRPTYRSTPGQPAPSANSPTSSSPPSPPSSPPHQPPPQSAPASPIASSTPTPARPHPPPRATSPKSSARSSSAATAKEAVSGLRRRSSRASAGAGTR
ncbi:MAG: hypothetical protein Q9195_008160 [Heterodermia aff. obscurata]